MPGDPSSVLAALGLDRRTEQLYFRLAPVSGHTVTGVAQLVRQAPEQLLRDLAPLLERGLVVLAEDRIVVPSLAEAVYDLVLQEASSPVRYPTWSPRRPAPTRPTSPRSTRSTAS
jgi:hypothetical protein